VQFCDNILRTFEGIVRRRRSNIDSSSKSNHSRRRRRKKLRRVDVKTAASSSTENVKKVDELSIKILPIYLQAAAITNAEILVAYF